MIKSKNFKNISDETDYIEILENMSDETAFHPNIEKNITIVHSKALILSSIRSLISTIFH